MDARLIKDTIIEVRSAVYKDGISDNHITIVLEKFYDRIRAAALRDGAESISKLPEAYNADYATVKVCASVLRNMAAAAEDRDGDK